MDLSSIILHKKDIDARLVSSLNALKETQINTWQRDLIERLLPFVVSGKTLRGCLVTFGYSLFAETIPDSIYKAAAGIELIHSGLLIHDDIMDRDVLRRGKASMYSQYADVAKQSAIQDILQFGISMGINAADFCFFAGYELLSDMPKSVLSYVSRELTHVTNAQMLDVSASMATTRLTEDEIFSVYRYKTARYTFSLPLVIGATAANAPSEVLQALELIGEEIGIIFQIRDDELALVGDPQKTGKPQGGDLREHKQTLLALYMQEAHPEILFDSLSLEQIIKHYNGSVAEHRLKEKIQKLSSSVTSSIHSLPIDDTCKKTLLDLAEFVQTRQN